MATFLWIPIGIIHICCGSKRKRNNGAGGPVTSSYTKIDNPGQQPQHQPGNIHIYYGVGTSTTAPTASANSLSPTAYGGAAAVTGYTPLSSASSHPQKYEPMGYYNGATATAPNTHPHHNDIPPPYNNQQGGAAQAYYYPTPPGQTVISPQPSPSPSPAPGPGVVTYPVPTQVAGGGSGNGAYHQIPPPGAYYNA